jgi:hypothetical protein
MLARGQFAQVGRTGQDHGRPWPGIWLVASFIQQHRPEEVGAVAGDKDRLRAFIAQDHFRLPTLAGQASIPGQANLEGQAITPRRSASRTPQGSETRQKGWTGRA